MNHLNWDDVRLFLALARTGTLSSAALTLRIGVATVSRRIERMEEALALPLFLRHQQGYDLTDQGAALLARAEAMEMSALNMMQDASAQRDIRGLVRLASFETLIMPFLIPALNKLLAANPGLDIELLYSTAMVNMHRHDADLALRMVMPDYGNLLVRRIATLGFGVYGPPDGERPTRHVIWPDLPDMGTTLTWSNAFGAQRGPRFAVNTLAAQIEAVRSGMGIAVLPHFLAKRAGLRLLDETLPDGTRMERSIFMVMNAQLASSRRVRAVAEAVETEIAAHRKDLERG